MKVSQAYPFTDISVVVPYLSIHCGVLQAYTTFNVPMKSYWVRLALSDQSLLSGLFMLTSRYIHHVQRQNHYFTVAIEYKLLCLRALNAILASGGLPDDSTVCTALMLALDDVSLLTYASAIGEGLTHKFPPDHGA